MADPIQHELVSTAVLWGLLPSRLWLAWRFSQHVGWHSKGGLS